MSNTAKDSFIRFTLSDRLQHILIMVSFAILGMTGLPQRFSNLDWARWLVNALGGIETARILHRASAITLGAVVIYHIAREVHGLATKRNRFDMLPRGKDFVDFFHNVSFMLGFRKMRPRFDRFSYMEKFEYWAVAWGMFSVGVTGMMLWFPGFVTRFLPGWAVPMAKAAHGGEALLAVLAIIVWHLYNTHLKPQNFPMNTSIFTGRISRHEMMLEHPLEYERMTGEKVPDEVLSEKAHISWPMLATAGAIGVATVVLFVATASWAIRPPIPTVRTPLHLPIAQREMLQLPPTPAPAASEAPQVWQGSAAKTPLAEFRAAPVAGQPGAYLFTDLSGGEIATRLWDFGDGTTSAEQHPLHTFQQCPNNLCTVTLTVCGPGGCAVEQKIGYILLAPQVSSAQ